MIHGIYGEDCDRGDRRHHEHRRQPPAHTLPRHDDREAYGSGPYDQRTSTADAKRVLLTQPEASSREVVAVRVISRMEGAIRRRQKCHGDQAGDSDDKQAAEDLQHRV